MKKIILNILGIIFVLTAFYSTTQFDNFLFYLITYLILAGICFYYAYKDYFIKNDHISEDEFVDSSNYNIYYTSKNFLSPAEINFYKKMKPILDAGYVIVPQVNLASIIEKHNAKYHSDLFRNIDFGIFDKDFNLLLLIELNDSSHQKSNRRDRDLKVKKILSDCKIKLLTFYTYYPNENDYVVKRILDNINNFSNDNIKQDN